MQAAAESKDMTGFENANQFALAVFLYRSELLRSPTCNFTRDDCTAEAEAIDELLVWHANRRSDQRKEKSSSVCSDSTPSFANEL